jgi:hypothetical protein
VALFHVSYGQRETFSSSYFSSPAPCKKAWTKQLKINRSKFKLIDEKLMELAEKLNAKVAWDDSQHYSNGVRVPPDYIESRRIE